MEDDDIATADVSGGRVPQIVVSHRDVAPVGGYGGTTATTADQRHDANFRRRRAPDDSSHDRCQRRSTAAANGKIRTLFLLGRWLRFVDAAGFQGPARMDERRDATPASDVQGRPLQHLRLLRRVGHAHAAGMHPRPEAFDPSESVHVRSRGDRVDRSPAGRSGPGGGAPPPVPGRGGDRRGGIGAVLRRRPAPVSLRQDDDGRHAAPRRADPSPPGRDEHTPDLSRIVPRQARRVVRVPGLHGAALSHRHPQSRGGVPGAALRRLRGHVGQGRVSHDGRPAASDSLRHASAAESGRRRR